jgi:hypothetical protein
MTSFPDPVSIFINVLSEDMEDLLGVPCSFHLRIQDH